MSPQNTLCLDLKAVDALSVAARFSISRTSHLLFADESRASPTLSINEALHRARILWLELSAAYPSALRVGHLTRDDTSCSIAAISDPVIPRVSQLFVLSASAARLVGVHCGADGSVHTRLFDATASPLSAALAVVALTWRALALHVACVISLRSGSHAPVCESFSGMVMSSAREGSLNTGDSLFAPAIAAYSQCFEVASISHRLGDHRTATLVLPAYLRVLLLLQAPPRLGESVSARSRAGVGGAVRHLMECCFQIDASHNSMVQCALRLVRFACVSEPSLSHFRLPDASSASESDIDGATLLASLQQMCVASSSDDDETAIGNLLALLFGVCEFGQFEAVRVLTAEAVASLVRVCSRYADTDAVLLVPPHVGVTDYERDDGTQRTANRLFRALASGWGAWLDEALVLAWRGSRDCASLRPMDTESQLDVAWGWCLTAIVCDARLLAAEISTLPCVQWHLNAPARMRGSARSLVDEAIEWDRIDIVRMWLDAPAANFAELIHPISIDRAFASGRIAAIDLLCERCPALAGRRSQALLQADTPSISLHSAGHIGRIDGTPLLALTICPPDACEPGTALLCETEALGRHACETVWPWLVHAGLWKRVSHTAAIRLYSQLISTCDAEGDSSVSLQLLLNVIGPPLLRLCAPLRSPASFRAPSRRLLSWAAIEHRPAACQFLLHAYAALGHGLAQRQQPFHFRRWLKDATDEIRQHQAEVPERVPNSFGVLIALEEQLNAK